MAGIFAFAESRDGEIRKVAHEVVTARARSRTRWGGGARGGAGRLRRGSGSAADLGRFGADKVFVGESEALGNYSPEGFTTVIADFIQEHGCDVALFPGSAMGKDLAPRVAAGSASATPTTAPASPSRAGRWSPVRPRYAGKVFARGRSPTQKPAVLSLRPNVFSPLENARAGDVRRWTSP
jgi:electron transfer flavoprotein alpha subunit